MHSQPDDYSISAVSGRITEELRREAAAFWLQNGALGSADEARRRADELVCVARNPAGEIVGVNTAYVSGVPGRKGDYYHYRMFLRPQDRHLHLARVLMKAAIAALREHPDAEDRVQGIALVAENPKLRRASGRRELAFLGWQPIGKDRRGLEVWTIEFDRPRIDPPLG